MVKLRGIEFADGQGDSMNAARRQDGGNAAAVRQTGIKDWFFFRDVIAQRAGDVLYGHAQLVDGNGDARNLFHDTLLFNEDICGRIEHDLADFWIENEILDLPKIRQDEPKSGMYAGRVHIAFPYRYGLFV